MEKMKAIAALEKGKVGVVEVPLPTWGEYECLVRITACGLCGGTDTKIVNDKVSDMRIEFPTLIGHEAVGVVATCGSKVRHLKEGDRVAAPHGTTPPAPYHSNWSCMAQYGFIHDIRAMLEDGVPTPNGVTEERDYQGVRLPDWISDIDAVMLITFKENYSALKNFGLTPGMKVLIYGDGAVACGVAQFARLMGAAWVGCAGHHDNRLEKIRQVARPQLAVNSGAENLQDALEEALPGEKLDLVIDCVGSLDIILEGARLLRPGGKVAVYGMLSEGKANLDLIKLPNNVCLHLLNWPYHEYRQHDEIMQFIQNGRLDPKDFYSHVLPIDKAEAGFALVAARKAYKVIFTMD